MAKKRKVKTEEQPNLMPLGEIVESISKHLSTLRIRESDVIYASHAIVFEIVARGRRELKLPCDEVTMHKEMHQTVCDFFTNVGFGTPELNNSTDTKGSA